MEAKTNLSAMGTEVKIYVNADKNIAEHILEVCKNLIEKYESMWSRFIPTSEISIINSSDGKFNEVNTETAQLISCMIKGYEISNGIYDATLLGDVLRSGYTKSFPFKNTSTQSNQFKQGTQRIKIKDSRVFVPKNVGLDPGGIGKGFAGDLISDKAMQLGATEVVIDIGGDVVTKCNEENVCINIPILNSKNKPVDVVSLVNAAVATSTSQFRKWKIDNEEVHHILDPRTSRSSDSDVLASTAISKFGWQAEVFAKTILILGSEEGLKFANEKQIPICVQTKDEIIKSNNWNKYVLKEMSEA